MRIRLYVVSLGLCLAAFAYDLVVWGALPALGEVGASIVNSAHLEAPLATTYIDLGGWIDARAPVLQAFGANRLREAFSEGFPRIAEDATVATDLIFNTTWNLQHRLIKTMYWAFPLLLLLTVLLYLRRQQQVHVIRKR